MTLRKPWFVGLAVLAAAVYLALWVGWSMQWGWLGAVDSRALDAFYRFGVHHPAWVTFWDVLCTVLGPTAFRIVGLVVIIVALRRRQLRLALFVVLGVEVSGLVTAALKAAADRPRPATALVFAPSSSFPSGHALCVSAAVLALTVIVLPLIRRDSWGWVIATGVVIGIVWMAPRLVSPWWALGLGMILGGALGNLMDRFFRGPGPLQGHVIDFVSIGWWPVFNVADPAVVGGAALLVGLSFFGYDFDTVGKRRADDESAELEKSEPDESSAEDEKRAPADADVSTPKSSESESENKPE